MEVLSTMASKIYDIILLIVSVVALIIMGTTMDLATNSGNNMIVVLMIPALIVAIVSAEALIK
jgi:hypothetical protein